MNKIKLYEKAVRTFGINAQMDMVIEECSELINAICKYRRGRVKEEDVITEIADVQIMCEQIAHWFGDVNVEAEKEYKLKRLEERLKAHKEKNRPNDIEL